MKNNNKEWEKCPCGRPLKINDRGNGTGFLYCSKCEPELRDASFKTSTEEER